MCGYYAVGFILSVSHTFSPLSEHYEVVTISIFYISEEESKGQRV